MEEKLLDNRPSKDSVDKSIKILRVMVLILGIYLAYKYFILF